MSQESDRPPEIHDIIGIQSKHFADLVRAAQLIYDPSAGVSIRNLSIDWEDFGVPRDVAENLKALGMEYQYASPHIPIEVVWSKLTPETRIWFIENKDNLWRFEEAFPALDED
jgi:hypothetical protein